MKLVNWTSSVSLIAMATAYAGLAHAQVAGPSARPDQGHSLAEVVVTAQKRAEALSKTAAAVSVIGQESLDNSGARSFNEAVSMTPNVSASTLGGTLAIRGLGASVPTAQSNGTVAYHLDGIFQNSKDQTGLGLYDIARIEVLRGPQGTLYGRNATAGVVNVITSDAGPDFEAFGDVSYARFHSLAMRGAVNIPLGESFAVRLTGTYENSDYWRRFASGKHPRELDLLNLRLALHAQISERITWNGRVSFTDQKSLLPVAVPTYFYNGATYLRASNPRDEAAIPSVAGIGGLGMFGRLPSVYKGLNYEQANTRHQRFYAFRSNLNIELSDAVALTYLLGYAYDKALAGAVISGLQPYQVSYADPRANTDWSHEINLNYRSDNVKAILGLYSFQSVLDQQDQLTRVFLPFISATNRIDHPTPLLDVSTFGVNEKKTTRAVFAQVTYDVSDRFRVTGGARYNWDRISFSPFVRSQCPFGSGLSAAQPDVAQLAPGLPLCSTLARAGLPGAFPPGFFYVNRSYPGGEKKFKKFSWKSSIEYDVSQDTMFYATVATGYKAGAAADLTVVGEARFYRPETNINYEAGIRSRLFDNTLSLNLTAFWTDYKDLQVETPDPNTVGRLISINAGKSRSRGLELEYEWAPTRSDRIKGYLTYLDAKFRDFLGSDPLTGITANFAGNRLPGAPEFSGRLAYSHTFELGSGGTITPTVQFYYQTKAYVFYTNTLPTLIPDYTRTDVIVRYVPQSEHYSIEGFINNIENKTHLSYIFPASGVSNAYMTPPRTYGVRFGFRY